MEDSQRIRTITPEFGAFFERVKVATRLSLKLSGYCLDDTESIQNTFEELIGKPVGDSFTLIPRSTLILGSTSQSVGTCPSVPDVPSQATQPSTSPTRSLSPNRST